MLFVARKLEMSNYLLSLPVNLAARKSSLGSLKNISESGQPLCAGWVALNFKNITTEYWVETV